LTDFGLARELKENEGTKTIAGTTVYYAPEMVLGYEYGYEVDLWTLGIYSYEMTNFSAPFASADISNKTKVKKLVLSAEANRVWKNGSLSN
jgi:serine/threonine protein kinase